jgi:hypothetical protein
LRKWPIISGRFFLPQESAAKALTKRLYGYLLKTNGQSGLD